MEGRYSLILTFFLFFFVTGRSSECEKDDFVCRGGECLPKEKVCDGYLDCNEGDDENDCAEIKICTSPMWFKCKSGACISSLLFCDGQLDCPDGDDEPEYCTPDAHLNDHKCLPSEFQCLNHQCINVQWVCDREPDCLDGSDETIGCEGKVSCDDGFLCKNKHCIFKEFHCDGDNDCGDNSDEANCTTKFHSTRQCSKEEGLFLCRDGNNCLEVAYVCDGIIHCSDGSDEKDCDLNSHFNETLCKFSGCSHTCHLAPNHTIMCTCPFGFKLDASLKTCIDVDECEEFGFCYQKCRNSVGGYECSCDQGYFLKADKRTCKAKGGEPLLLFSSFNQIRGIYLQSKVYFTVTTQTNRVIGVSHSGKHIYWTELNRNEAVIVRSNEDGSERTTLVDSGLKLPEDLEVDYITGNIYFTDAEEKHIGVCNEKGLCTSLINEDIEKPRAIALFPQKSIMFWSDWGKTPKIASSGMDGCHHKAIVDKNLEWPNGLALDASNERIYWVDAKIRNIESVRLDGSDRRIILEGAIKHPFSIALFEDTLFWSDWENFQIEMCNKFTGKNHSSLVKEKRITEGETKHSVYGVHIYHPALHPRMPNPCQSHACSHLCLLSQNSTYKCSCPENYQLGSDLHICKNTSKAFQIVVGGSTQIFFVSPRLLGKLEVTKQDFNSKISGIDCMVFDTLSGHLLLSDSLKRTIFRYDFRKKIITPLLSTGLGKITSMSFDSYGNNLYVCDEEKLMVQVWSLTTKYSLSVYRATGGEIPQSVVVVPENGLFFVAVSFGNRVNINRINMDGTQILPQIVGSSVRGPKVILIYDKKSKKIFWTNSDSEWIESANLDGTDRDSVQTTKGKPVSFVSQNGLLIWINTDSHALNSFDIYKDQFPSETNQIVNLGADHQTFRSLAVVTSLESHTLHPCQDYLKHGCTHLCLVSTNSNGVCACPLGMHLSFDNKTCIYPAQCTDGQFKCRTDDLCISRIQRCDGQADCPSGDDEKDCETENCKTDQFKCANGQCIELKEKCDGQYDCSDHSDEKNCSSQCFGDNFHCGSGECIPQSWICDFVKDCDDGSDEHNCGDKKCPPNKFKCNSGTCISAGWECDGEPDCIDGSDEHEKCEKNGRNCKSEEFQCDNGRCVSFSFVCDGQNDCGDHSDEFRCSSEGKEPECKFGELLCSKAAMKCVPQAARCNGTAECPRGEDEKDCVNCLPSEFKCRNSKCITKSWMCDKENDCGDNSDEDPIMCSHIKVGTVGYVKPCEEFSCKSGECLPLHLVCNEIHNCVDGSDEGPNCDFVCNHNPCEQICVKTPLAARCACLKGFTLSGDGRSCKDIDECAQGKCSQICHNSPGGFNCTCTDDYVLKSDRMTCKAKGSKMSFILSGDDEIRKVSHNFHRMDLLVLDPGALILGLDVDTRRNRIFWSSGSSNSINSLDITTGKKMVMENMDRPGMLSYDWLTENVFYIDKSSINKIKVCNLSNKKSSEVLTAPPNVLISNLAVEPPSGFIFYSQARSSALQRPVSTILKYSFETQNSSVLVSSDISWVSGIVVDRIRRHVYWSDLYHQVIERMGFNGEQRQIVFQEQVRRPESLMFFEDSLIWLTRGASEIKKCILYGEHKGQCDTLSLYIYDTKFLTIMQESRQPNITNPCEGFCNIYSVCVATPEGPKCVCENGGVISPNEKCDRSSLKTFSEYRTFEGKEKLFLNNKKQPLNGNTSAVLGILFAALAICGFSAAYLYIKKKKSNIVLDTMHFHNPSFGLSHLEHNFNSNELVPGEHRYENPMQKLIQNSNGKFGDYFKENNGRVEKKRKFETKDCDSDSDSFERTDMNANLIR